MVELINFPRFWREKPALWFVQVESTFALNDITTDAVKYDYIITELDNDMLSLVEDVLLDNSGENGEDKYMQLKDEIIQRLSVSKLENEELGTKKPSHFLQHLRKNADQRVTDETVKRIWLKQLPKHVREIVNVESSGDIDVLSEMADKVMQVVPTEPPQNSQIADCGTIAEHIFKCFKKLEKLSALLENVQGQLEKLQEASKPHNIVSLSKEKECDTDSTVDKVQESLSPQKKSTTICWFHKNIEDKTLNGVGNCVFREKPSSKDDFNTSF